MWHSYAGAGAAGGGGKVAFEPGWDLHPFNLMAFETVASQSFPGGSSALRTL